MILGLFTQLSYAQQKPASSRKATVENQSELFKTKMLIAEGKIPKPLSKDNDAGLPNASRNQSAIHKIEAVCATYNGSLGAGDPTTNFRPFRDGVVSACGPVKACTAGIAQAGSFYDVYTFTNPLGSTQCVNVTFTNGAAGIANFVAVFQSPFVPPTSAAGFCSGNTFLGDIGSSNQGGATNSFSFTIPASTAVDIVVYALGATPTPNYTLVIDAPTCFAAPCSGTPAPGNTLASANPVCPGINFTLSLQNNPSVSGLTYQWESSADGTTWSSITGATNASLVRSQTAVTWYRCQVTCSGNTGTSNPVQVGLNPPTSCYCLPGATDCSDNDMITRVLISTLDNSSTCGSGPPPGYSDFTALPATNVYSGAGNPITVELPPNWTEGVAVWIDYNVNGQFEASEYTGLGSKPAGQTSISGNINIPASALNGPTRMRVRCRFAAVPASGDACIGYAFGETEDYTVNIQPCVPITITGSPSNTSGVCGGTASFVATTTGTYPAYQWEYRVNSSSTWQLVSNGGVYSGATSATLTLTNFDATYNGYQYRAIVSGGCSGPDFTNFATLTVTPIVPVVNPSSATICLGSIQSLSLINTMGNVNLMEEGFNTVSPLPAGWASQNLSSPAGTTGWFQGNTGVFPAQSGPADSYIGANYQNTSGAGTISNWLFTPQFTTIKNGDAISFWTRKVAPDAFPDRLELRMSTNGASTNAGATATSVGDFSTLLLSVNPTLVTGVYPTTWTKYTYTVIGLSAPVSGRFAFRYFVTNGGPAGSNSDYIGIDNVVFTSAGGFAQGTWGGPAGTIFTDAAATTAYTGTLATTVYVKPLVSGLNNYTVNFTTLTPCTSATTTVPVNVSTPISNRVGPSNKSVCVGGTTSFSVSASGGPITYRWQRSVDGGVTWTNVSGATSATLTLSDVAQTMNNYRYRVILNAAPCGIPDTTAAAILTVNALPVVTISASDIALAPTQTATITATSTPGPLNATSWSWTLNGQFKSGNVNTQSVDMDSLGVYQATVTDINGCVNTSNLLEMGAEASDKLWIYPNPTAGAFQVRLYFDGSDVNEKRIITIFDIEGRQIMSREFDLRYTTPPYLRMDFDLSNMARGTYVVKVAHKYTGKVVSGLLLVQ